MLGKFLTATVCLAFVAAAGIALAVNAPARADPGGLDAIRSASALDSDPKDSEAVAAVCTACHSASQFLTAPRSNIRWQQLYQEMLDRGATGTNEQLSRVVNYLLENLTIVNVNTSPAAQLVPTLQITRDVAANIVARRTQRPFTGIDDLSAMHGVDRSVIERLKAANCLQF